MEEEITPEKFIEKYLSNPLPEAEMFGIETKDQLKIRKLYAGLPVFTTVPTYTGFQGEHIWVVSGGIYYLYAYIDAGWRKIGSTAYGDHGSLDGLADDDHTQYHNNTRGDARYYTETELDAGQLDTRYYTETEVDDFAVKLTGDQTIAGVKTHSSFPITPSSTPTTNYQVANKKYVDDLPRATIAFVDTNVYNGAAPISPTDLNLSSVVGANRALVYLRIVYSNAGGWVKFRENGETTTDCPIGTAGASSTSLNEVFYLWVLTDSSGIVEFTTGSNDNINVTVKAYIK